MPCLRLEKVIFCVEYFKGAEMISLSCLTLYALGNP